jgi:hypothetical protein
MLGDLSGGGDLGLSETYMIDGDGDIQFRHRGATELKGANFSGSVAKALLTLDTIPTSRMGLFGRGADLGSLAISSNKFSVAPSLQRSICTAAKMQR